jgi:hypothetical protein
MTLWPGVFAGLGDRQGSLVGCFDARAAAMAALCPIRDIKNKRNMGAMVTQES